MALQTDLNINGDLTKGAYVIVDVVSGNKSSAQMIVSVFSNQAKERLIANINYSIPVDVSEDAPNFIKQGYNYLKSLSGFAGSKDV